MNLRYLVPRLVVPLLAASALSVLASVRVHEPWSGLAVNLAAAFLGSILTILYVDVVLRHHQEIVWRKVQSKVFIRLERIANATISSVRTAFGIDVPDDLMYRPDDLSLMRREILRLAQDVLIPVRPKIQRMNQSDWRTLAMNLQLAIQEGDRTLTLFARNLDSRYTSLLLDIQEEASFILGGYSIWPDLLGV